MPLTLKPFQEEVCEGIVARFANLATLYGQLAAAAPADFDAARRRDAVVVLQAPTGSGKTAVAIEALRRHARRERVLWFWFAPFAGLVEQAGLTLADQAPELARLSLDADRRTDAVLSGGVFVTTWASVAAARADSRRARTRGDEGMSVDDLVERARAEGLRIGCVVDEAHHGFQRAAQARAFFRDVLAPDYALLMTATPRDRDVPAFEQATGYRVGEPADWASVSRSDAVGARLLKRGVRVVRFLAADDNTRQLVDFEHLALRECAAAHRMVADALAEAGMRLTPLMLVQVPDGGAAQKEAARYLVEDLGFDEQAVRIHTAKEPDPDLIALANDPTVEVLVFKMAVALGFDAPRAFTLAALRGARDPGFGVQVIGRIVRRHALLQATDELPPVLDHGYVFLANAASQEGLLEAGEQINSLGTQAPAVGTQTVVTVIGERAMVQVARSGEPLALVVDAGGTHVEGEAGATDAPGDLVRVDREALSAATRRLFELDDDASGARAHAERARPAAAGVFSLVEDAVHVYPRRGDAPPQLRGEALPQPGPDFEARLAGFVNFDDAVLASRMRRNVRVQRSETEILDGRGTAEGHDDVWASLAPAAVAMQAEQLRLRLRESNDRELMQHLVAAFRRAIENSGADVPDDEEDLYQQLDLVLVRHPRLLRDAYRRLRHSQVQDIDVMLPAELHSDTRLEPAARALYGVYPPGMNADEMSLARSLDASPLVRWWHRNPSRRPGESVGLYRWDEGEGFFPDFVASILDRDTPHGVVLVEFKGEHLWSKPEEVDKASAEHADYGRVYMVGRPKGADRLIFLNALHGRLESSGPFDVERLRHRPGS